MISKETIDSYGFILFYFLDVKQNSLYHFVPRIVFWKAIIKSYSNLFAWPTLNRMTPIEAFI